MTGRIAVGTLAVVAALGMSACGSGDKNEGSKPKTSKPAATSVQNVPPVPTVEQLNTELGQALDPNVPAEQKVQFLEDGQASLQKDPDMIKKLSDAYQQNNAQIQVTDVTYLGGDTLTAKANFSVNGQPPNEASVPFVVQGDQWVLQKSWACAGIQNLGQASPACS
ncbi:hypothetical protein [Nocardia sp. BMG51109]|uniref:hypothetical protein n=1 Tax=Nocardia sp. BMG51109 TaxID=1056816 RepID=UPI0004B1EE27|nr:hypothetical protein [Nocardia sp. BMG51109]